ncbi:MAG: hypothetical protein C5B52_02315 [Bacteroidetes bacterium]|nr:MAG: hypothetical protein C5B52_02315 [Bacteroidota bacterium]
MRNKSLISQSFVFVVGIAFLVSCNSSKYAGGFSYKSKDPGMDIASSGYTAPVAEKAPEEISLNDNAETTEVLTDAHVKISPEQNEKLSEVRALVIEEYYKQKMKREVTASQAPIKSSEIIANVATQMQEKGMIENISEKKLHKIEKMADKMDKKAEKRGGFLGEGIDLFLAILAIAGLAVALIFGTFIGVIIFLVAGGIWLYRKLVH